MPFHASVASSKGAIEGLTKSLAAEYAPKFRVNSIAPSLTDTNLADKFLNNESKLDKASARHPLKSIGSAEDIADTTCFLLSAKSQWMTGQILNLDGGIGNLKTNISNKKIKQSINGNTNTVYIDPLNSLKFVLNKLKKDKIKLNKDFYVFTGSTVGIVPILGKGVYTGKIDKLGSVKAIIS